MLKFLLVFISITFCFSLKNCVNDKYTNTIICDCESSTNSNFIGNTICKRFESVKFDNLNCRSSKFSKSGKYSTMIDNDHPYGMTYQIKNVQSKEHFKISVWRHKSNKNGCLAVNSDKIEDLYLTQNKTNKISENDWEQLSFDLIIPQSASGKDIQIYVFNEGNALPIYFEDLSIEYITNEIANSNFEESSFLDSRDGQNYKTIKIGNDWWMAENLNYQIPDSSFCYGNKEANCETFGKLYSYNLAIKSCPQGWRLPSDEDWKMLERNIGMEEGEISKYGNRGYDESVALREFGNTNFNVKLAGACESGFYNLHLSAYFWTSTEIDITHAYCREISHRLDIGRFKDNKTMYFSVRCIKN